MDITIDKNSEGAWRLSAFVGEGINQYLMTKTYYFHTKADAIKKFKIDLKEVK